jgi:hypothetical protein
MTIDDFIATQLQVIRKHGIETYLPALHVETRWRIKVSVMTDGPDDGVELEPLVRAWAERLAKSHDYGLGFRVNEYQFRVVVRVCGHVSERLVEVAST